MQNPDKTQSRRLDAERRRCVDEFASSESGAAIGSVGAAAGAMSMTSAGFGSGLTSRSASGPVPATSQAPQAHSPLRPMRRPLALPHAGQVAVITPSRSRKQTLGRCFEKTSCSLVG
ncbi:MAG: hypothetical protein ACYTEQ_28130 [Planctomycetota bacterium]